MAPRRKAAKQPAVDTKREKSGCDEVSECVVTIKNFVTCEEFYLRLFWGLGLMMFVLIVSLPFYVMVMTSLKSQQSLIINPLDFSIDYSLGVTKLLRSYIELFTNYDFMTLLINSTVVSLATVLITLLFLTGLFFSLVSTSLIVSDKLDTNDY